MKVAGDFSSNGQIGPAADVKMGHRRCRHARYQPRRAESAVQSSTRQLPADRQGIVAVERDLQSFQIIALTSLRNMLVRLLSGEVIPALGEV